MNYSQLTDNRLKDARSRGDVFEYVKAKQWRIRTSPFDKYRLRLVSGILEKNPAGCVIEIGCDIGMAVASYARNSHKIVLCDRDLFSLKGARIVNKENLAKMEFVSADIASLPLKENLFNTVICFEVLEHVDRDRHDKVLRELMRISKAGASIYLSTPNKFSIPGAEGKILEFFVKGYKWNGWDTDHKYIYGTGELLGVIRKYSHNIEMVRGFYFLPGSLTVRAPLFVQNFLGFLSYLFSKYLGSIPPFRGLGFTTIVEFKKKN